MNNIYVDELPKSCDWCPCCHYDDYNGVYRCEADIKRPFKPIIDWGIEKLSTCPLKPLTDRLAEERKKVVGELKVDIRSLFNSYASSLIDYCIWNKNADENQKLYNNFKRIINDRLVKVLDLFDKRIDQIERGTDD